MTQRNGWLWCAVAALLFGAATPTTKLLIDDVHPVTLAGLLYFGAALAVAPFARRDQRSKVAARQRVRLSVAVVLGGGVAPVLLMLALARTPAGTLSMLLNLELVATAVIARVLLREHIGARASAGITMVVVGGVVLAGAHGASLALGALLVAGACVCWGADNAITASLDSYGPAQITLVKGMVAGSVNALIGISIDGLPPWRLVVVALLIGALGYGVSITMWITGARLVGAARGQVIFALAPFVGALLAWPLNGEGISGTLLVAFAISLTGVLIVGTAGHGHAHVHDAFEHAHPIDPRDPHHSPSAIEVVGGEAHRHLALAHQHDHLPDIHHRHAH